MTTSPSMSLLPSLPRRAAGVAAAFLTVNVTGALIAMAMGPVVGPSFGALLRDPARDGLNLPALTGGYLVISIVLGLLCTRLGVSSVREGATLGLTLGLATFLGDHLVTSGWSTMPVGAMALSGLLDPLSVAAAGAALAFVTTWRRERT